MADSRKSGGRDREAISRRRFVASGGAAVAASALPGACGGGDDAPKAADEPAWKFRFELPGPPPARFGEGDLGVLNYALRLEYIAATACAAAERSGRVEGETLGWVRGFGADDRAHVAALRQAIADVGGEPASRPSIGFRSGYTQNWLDLLVRLKNLNAAGYLGQLANLEDRGALATLASVHSVEARHASVLNTFMDQTFVPYGGFPRPGEAEDVLSQIEPGIRT